MPGPGPRVYGVRMADLSFLGVGVAALAFFVLGAAWYTVLFGRAWRAEMGISEQEAADASPDPRMFAVSIVVALVLAGVLGWLIDDQGAGYGLRLGLITGAGIGAGVIAQNAVYESRSIRYVVINGGYVTLGLGLVGLIVGFFQAP